MSKKFINYLIGNEEPEKRLPRWWFGGICSATAISVTHPIDLIKVHLQTQQVKIPVSELIKNVYKNQGIIGFYNGISAAWFRQLTYTTARFAIYESGKPYVNADSVGGKIFLAFIAGVIGGYIGVPSDVVNVRLQNDSKLPPEKRRNYKHIFDGLYRITKEEGVKNLFRGSVPSISRAILLTIGTNATYDQVKQMLVGELQLPPDNIFVHFLTSSITAVFGTVVTQPLDVIKTTYMNAKPGEFKNILDVTKFVATGGPFAFYKGFIPALLRIGPNTILTFIFYEQLRIRFGKIVKN